MRVAIKCMHLARVVDVHPIEVLGTIMGDRGASCDHGQPRSAAVLRVMNCNNATTSVGPK